MRYYELTNNKCSFIYESICPPNNSVSETWTTHGIENDGAQITFLEYEFYDKDPDGVREAYGCMYDFEYKVTINTEKADENKLFAYTVTKDKTIVRGYDIDMKSVRMVYIFTKPQEIRNEEFVLVAEKIEALKRAPNEQESVKELINNHLIRGNEDVACLVAYNDRA